jgi:hypothetical protein
MSYNRILTIVHNEMLLATSLNTDASSCRAGSVDGHKPDRKYFQHATLRLLAATNWCPNERQSKVLMSRSGMRTQLVNCEQNICMGKLDELDLKAQSTAKRDALYQGI